MSALSDKGITLEGLAAAVDALRQELATWKALAHKQDQLSADQITATQSGATAAKISQIAVNTAAIQSLAAQVAGQISLAYVTTLPATGEPLTLYLVPQGDGTAPNFCNEYLWINDAWELIGTTGAMANNGELSIQVNGVTVGTFTANQAANSTVNITVPTNTNQLINGAGYVDTAALQAALLLKQNNLTAVQLEAVNSGITAAAVQQIADNATAISGKQDALTAAQQAAVDSGATAAKIDQIASNASAIVSLTSSKQDQLSTTQLAAVNSGVTAAAVQQIGTNASNISGLQTAVASKAADNAVVHLAGAETISGDKTFTGTNRFGLSLSQKGFSPRASVPVSNEFGQFAVVDTDNNSVMSINYANRTTGVRDFTFRVYDSTGNVNGAGVFKDASDNYSFCSLDPNRTISLGNSGNQWSSVYAQTYYYNGTAWGLDKENHWSFNQWVEHNSTPKVLLKDLRNDRTYSATDKYGGVMRWECVDKDNAPLSRISTQLRNDKAVLLQFAIYNENSSGAEFDRTLRFVTNTSGESGQTSFYPEQSDTVNLGTSSNKWKTLNGINPGALSIPNMSSSSRLDISGDMVPDSYGNIVFTPQIYGWVYIDFNVASATITSGTVMLAQIKDNNLANTSFAVNYVRPESSNHILVWTPVWANRTLIIEVNFSGFSVGKAYIYPCLGNV